MEVDIKRHLLYQGFPAQVLSAAYLDLKYDTNTTFVLPHLCSFLNIKLHSEQLAQCKATLQLVKKFITLHCFQLLVYSMCYSTVNLQHQQYIKVQKQFSTDSRSLDV